MLVSAHLKKKKEELEKEAREFVSCEFDRIVTQYYATLPENTDTTDTMETDLPDLSDTEDDSELETLPLPEGFEPLVSESYQPFDSTDRIVCSICFMKGKNCECKDK